MLRVFRRSRRKFRQPRARGEKAPPAGLPGRHGPLVGDEAHRLQRGDPRGDLGGLADGQGHHPPADDQGHQDGRSVVQGVEPLGEEGQAHQRPQHHPRQQAQAPQPAALPVDHPPDLPGGGPQGAQLAIALDLVLDGDAENALDHQAAPRQHQRPQHQHHGQDLPEVAAVVVPEIHVGEPRDGEVQVLRRLAVEGLDGLGRQGLVPGQVDVGQVPGGVVVRPPLQGGVGEDHGKLRPGRRLLAQDAGDHIGAGEAGGVQGDGIPQPGAVGVLGQPVGPQGHLVVLLGQAPLGQGHLVAEGVEKVLVHIEVGGLEPPGAVLGA